MPQKKQQKQGKTMYCAEKNIRNYMSDIEQRIFETIFESSNNMGGKYDYCSPFYVQYGYTWICL